MARSRLPIHVDNCALNAMINGLICVICRIRALIAELRGESIRGDHAQTTTVKARSNDVAGHLECFCSGGSQKLRHSRSVNVD